MMGSRGLAIAVALVAGGFLLHVSVLITEPMQWFSPGVLALALLFWAYLLWRLPDTPLHRSSLCAMVGGTMVGVAVQRHMLGAHWSLALLDAATSVIYWFCWWQQLKILQLQTMLNGATAVRPDIFGDPQAIPPSQAIRYANADAARDGGDGADGPSGLQVITLDTDYSDMPAVYFGLDGEPIGGPPSPPAPPPRRSRRTERGEPAPPPEIDASIPERRLDRKPRSP